MTVISKKKQYLGVKLSTLIVSSVIFSQQAFAYEPSLSAGVTAGTLGFGISLSGSTQLHLFQGDKVQWRTAMTGFEYEDEFSSNIAGITYDASDFSESSLQIGFDWYPIQSSGWINDIFLSGGLLYQDYSASYSADNSKAYTVGSTTVNPGDLDSFTVDADRTEIAPYISLGWGNKIEKMQGFDIQVEVGLTLLSSETSIDLSAQGSNNNLTASDLTKEKQNIKDELDGVNTFASITLAYHF